MNGRIVETVAGNHLRLVGAVAVAKASGIIIHPGDGTAEFLHASDVADVLQIRHSVVVLVEKTGQ